MSNKLKSITLDGVTKEVDSGGGGGSMTKEEILAALGYEEIEVSMTSNNGNSYSEIILAKIKPAEQIPPYKIVLHATFDDSAIESMPSAEVRVGEMTATIGDLTFTRQNITVNAEYGYFKLPIIVESKELIEALPLLQQVSVSIANLTCEGVSLSGTGVFNSEDDNYFRWDGTGDFESYFICWEGDMCVEVEIDMAYPLFIVRSTPWGSGELTIDNLTIVAQAPASVQGQNICDATDAKIVSGQANIALNESEYQTLLQATSASLVAHNLRNNGVIVSGGETVTGAVTPVTSDEWSIGATFTLEPSSFGRFDMYYNK